MGNNNQISISLNTVIILGVCFLVLLLIPIGFIIYNNSKSETNEQISNVQTALPDDNTILTNTSSSTANSTTNTTSNTTTNTATITTTNTTTNSTISSTNNTISSTNSTTSTDSSDSSNTNSTIAKTSTKYNPLSVGEWGTASKIDTGSTIVNVPIKVTNVIRGATAAQKVKDFCSTGSFYKYSEPKSGMEWAVVEYNIDLTNITATSSSGKGISVSSKITGTGDHSSIVYNGTTYIVSTMNMTPRL